MALHGEIRKLGEKRSRTEINVMLKEGTCRKKRRKYRNVISNEVKADLFVVFE